MEHGSSTARHGGNPGALGPHVRHPNAYDMLASPPAVPPFDLLAQRACSGSPLRSLARSSTLRQPWRRPRCGLAASVVLRRATRSRCPPSLDGEGFGDGRPLPVFAVTRSRLSALPSLNEPLRVLKPGGDDPSAREAETLEEIRTFFEMVIQGTTIQLAGALERSLYRLESAVRVPPRRGGVR